MIKDLSIHNKFEFEVIDVRTNKVRQQAVAYNVICSGFWDRCTLRLTSSGSSGGEWNSGIVYGDGTGTPSENDTALFNKRGYKAYTGNAEMISDNRVDGVLAARRKTILNPEEAVDIDISEIGMSEGGTALLTHAMLQDMNGNTIVIHKTDTDLINIYATVYLHWDSNEVYLQDDRSISYSSLNGTIFRLFGFGGWGTSVSSGGASLTAALHKAGRPAYGGNFPTVYLPSSAGCALRAKGYKWNKERLDANSGNETGGYRYIAMGSGATSIILDIAKVTDPSEITQEAVATGDGTTKRFGTLFDFPYDAKVYVNGALKTSGVTVRRHPGKRFHLLADYVDMLVGNSTYSKQILSFPNFNSGWVPFRVETEYYSYSESGLLRNIAYEIGITHVQRNASDSTFQVSNDLVDWIDLTPSDWGKTAVATEYQNYKFYKVKNMRIFPTTYDGCNIEFDVAPADGDVITIDYTTDVLAKDSEHVYDFEFDLSFDALLS